jgi:hypothetical protein
MQLRVWMMMQNISSTHNHTHLHQFWTYLSQSQIKETIQVREMNTMGSGTLIMAMNRMLDLFNI